MIKTYEGFLNLHLDQRLICRKYGIKNYTINSDGSIDVRGSVDLTNKELTKLPLKFNRVTGDFDCKYNKLTSLEGAPQEIGGHFYCKVNDLISLVGAPEKVGGSFWCQHNRLTSLEGAPQKVKCDFDCSYNTRLISLEGAPQEVDNFSCQYTQLTSLKGSPRKVNTNFRCEYESLATVLQGDPQTCKIWTFEGAPDHVGGWFDCYGNLIFNIWRLFADYSKMEFFNECDPIREVKGKPAIVLDRLNGFLEEIGKESVENVEGYLNI